MSRILFGLVLALILIGISYLSAKAYAAGFRLSGTKSSIVFLSFLAAALLFVLGMALSRSAGSALSSTLYSATQILAGFAFYFFIGAIALLISLLAYRILAAPFPLALAWTITIASFLLGTIGLVQARYIQTTPYTITLAGAPSSWNGKVAALVSDTHFGLINQGGFSDKVVQNILSLNPDLVLHAGDFYDGPRIDTIPISASWKQLADRVPVFYAPGNHEQYGDYGGFIASVQDAGVTVLEDTHTLYDGVAIVGFMYRGADGKNAIAPLIEKMGIEITTPSIAINHAPVFHDAFAESGIDLLVSGHTHRGQFWPLNFLIRRIYGKYYYGASSFGGMQTITTSGVGTFGPPFRLFNTPEIVLLRFVTK